MFLRILDINLSFLLWFVAFSREFGYQFVVFAMICGIFLESKTVVRIVCGVS